MSGVAARRKVRVAGGHRGPVPWGVLWFGVLPLAGLGAEQLSLGANSSLFPTPLHVAAGAGIGLVNLWLHAVHRWGSGRLAGRAFGAGLVGGFAGTYALTLLPLLPFIVMISLSGVFAVHAILALSPFFACLGLLPVCRAVVEERRRTTAPNAVARLFLLGAAAFPGIALPAELLRRDQPRGEIAQAVNGTGWLARLARSRLRAAPLDDQILAAAHGLAMHHVTPIDIGLQFGWFLDGLTGRRRPVEPAAARALFYRLHGTPWSKLLVAPTNPDAEWHPNDGWIDVQPVLRGEAHPGVRESVALSESVWQIDVETAAALARLDWTLSFSNATPFAQEATLRLAIAEPGVASALSLWIDGTERPAAFGSDEKVVAAYESVTATRRDPALLREVAPGTLDLRVFPVPPGGTARVRLAVTVPLDGDEATLHLDLPRLRSRNFYVSPLLRHAVAVRAGVAAEARQLADTELFGARWSWPQALRRCHARDAQGIVVQEAAVRAPTPRCGRLFAVVEASRTAAEHRTAPALLLGQWPRSESATVYLVGAEATTRREAPAADAGWAAWLARAEYAGGVDAGPALADACRIAADDAGATIVWLHARQEHALEPASDLESSARACKAPLIAVALTDGDNLTRDRLLRAGALVVWPQQADLAACLGQLTAIGVADGPSALTRAARVQRTFGRPEAPPDDAAAVSDQLARLAVASEARALLRTDPPAALALAARYRLVTAGAAAVVLETGQDYRRFDLDPGAPIGQEPRLPIGSAVPEPATWLLLACGLATLAWATRARRP